MDLNGSDSEDDDERTDEDEAPILDDGDDVQIIEPPPPHAPAPAPPPPPHAPPPPPQPQAPPPPPPQPPVAPGGVRAILASSLTSRFPDLAAHLAAAAVDFGETHHAALPPHTVHWVCGATRLPRVAIVYESAEVVRLSAGGTLHGELDAAQRAAASFAAGGTLSLIVVGKGAGGLERTLDAVQHSH